MCMLLVKVAEEVIKSFLFRGAGAAFFTKSPLTEHSCSIAIKLQSLRQSGILRSQCFPAVAPDKCMSHILTGHQRTPRRGADGTSRIKPRKLCSLAGKPVNV